MTKFYGRPLYALFRLTFIRTHRFHFGFECYARGAFFFPFIRLLRSHFVQNHFDWMQTFFVPILSFELRFFPSCGFGKYEHKKKYPRADDFWFNVVITLLSNGILILTIDQSSAITFMCRFFATKKGWKVPEIFHQIDHISKEKKMELHAFIRDYVKSSTTHTHNLAFAPLFWLLLEFDFQISIHRIYVSFVDVQTFYAPYF